MKQGVCKFCGQIFMVDSESEDNDVLDDKATMQCSCEEAKKEQSFRERVKKAKSDVAMVFNEAEEEAMRAVLLGSIEKVAHHDIDSIQVRYENVTGTVKLDSNNLFDIKKITKVEKSN